MHGFLFVCIIHHLFQVLSCAVFVTRLFGPNICPCLAIFNCASFSFFFGNDRGFLKESQDDYPDVFDDLETAVVFNVVAFAAVLLDQLASCSPFLSPLALHERESIIEIMAKSRRCSSCLGP
jgi:hypothetical protein